MREIINLLLKSFQVFILFILFISAIYLPDVILLYSGYCWKEKRYLSDQEKFDRVVAALIKERASVNPYIVNDAGGIVSNTGLIGGSIDASPHYASLDEFYALNPKCCEFVEYLRSEGIVSIPFLTRASGDVHTRVRVFYIYHFEVQYSNQPRSRER
jgi:hypothetical protein